MNTCSILQESSEPCGGNHLSLKFANQSELFSSSIVTHLWNNHLGMANPAGITGRDLVIEDPCISYVPELEQYTVAYTSYARGGSKRFGRTYLMTSKNFERYGVIMPEEDKDGGTIWFEKRRSDKT